MTDTRAERIRFLVARYTLHGRLRDRDACRSVELVEQRSNELLRYSRGGYAFRLVDELAR